jgi:hypothetical protein
MFYVNMRIFYLLFFLLIIIIIIIITLKPYMSFVLLYQIIPDFSSIFNEPDPISQF